MNDVLPIEFKASPVSTRAKIFDTRVIVKKPFRFIRYSPVVPDDGVAISYVGMVPISKDNLSIVDEGPRNYENSDYVLRERTVTGPIFTSIFGKFLVTDLTVARPGQDPLPLFYAHDLSAETTVSELVVLDKDQREVDASSYVYDAALKVLYHNRPSSGDPLTGEFDVSYVQFLDANDQKVFRLLRDDPAYTEHTLLDGPEDPTKRRYRRNDTGANFSITMLYNNPANGNTFWFKGIQDGQVRVEAPADDTPEDNWWVRFSNGDLYAPVGGAIHRYHVPEWVSQAFLPVMPYRRAAYRTANIFSRRVVQTRRFPMSIDTANGRYVDILVLDEAGRAKRGYTNRPSSDPLSTYWVSESGEPTTTRLTSLSTVDVTFNEESGFIHLDKDLEVGDQVVVNYYYKERYLEYLAYNFNPVFNPGSLNQRVVFYVNPDVPAGGANQAIHHIAFNEKTLVTEGYSDPLLSVPGDSTSIDDLHANYDTYAKFIRNKPAVLLIAFVDVMRKVAPEDLVKHDTRVRGGGIKDSVSIAAYYDQFPELAFVPDIANWDGRPFPGRHTAWVELPYHLISGKGSLAPANETLLTEEEVREIVGRHMALGAYPLIRWYGDKPTIDSLTRTTTPNGDATDNTNTTLTITWTSVPGATGYKLYYGRSSTAGFTELAETTLLTATITGLLDNVSWYAYVVPQYNGVAGLKSDTVYILPGSDRANVECAADAVLVEGWGTVSCVADAIIDFAGQRLKCRADAVLI